MSFPLCLCVDSFFRALKFCQYHVLVFNVIIFASVYVTGFLLDFVVSRAPVCTIITTYNGRPTFMPWKAGGALQTVRLVPSRRNVYDTCALSGGQLRQQSQDSGFSPSHTLPPVANTCSTSLERVSRRLSKCWLLLKSKTLNFLRLTKALKSNVDNKIFVNVSVSRFEKWRWLVDEVVVNPFDTKF